MQKKQYIFVFIKYKLFVLLILYLMMGNINNERMRGVQKSP